jgi:hypothetical protein
MLSKFGAAVMAATVFLRVRIKGSLAGNGPTDPTKPGSRACNVRTTTRIAS